MQSDPQKRVRLVNIAGCILLHPHPLLLVVDISNVEDDKKGKSDFCICIDVGVRMRHDYLNDGFSKQ